MSELVHLLRATGWLVPAPGAAAMTPGGHGQRGDAEQQQQEGGEQEAPALVGHAQRIAGIHALHQHPGLTRRLQATDPPADLEHGHTAIIVQAHKSAR